MTDEGVFAVEDDLLDDQPPPSTTDRWQYRVVNMGMFNTPERLAMVLGQLGAQGWELVHVYDKMSNWIQSAEKGFAIFKRPVLPGAAPEGPWASWTRAVARPLPAPEKGTAEGWLADPSGRHPDRYWDGKAWTHWVRDKAGGTRSEDPAVADVFG